jgi:TRAP-type C4-dicarboxylate transport system permease small subunit
MSDDAAVEYSPSAVTDAFGPVGRALLQLSKWAAIGGGLIFVALVCMSIVAIVGRKLFAFSLTGDVEVLQMGAAFASAAFFAYCHMIHGDVKVDFFTAHLAPRKVALLDAFGSLLIGLFGALIAWRTAVGAASLKEVHETSAMLGWPVWVAQALMVPGFVLLSVVGLYMCVHLLRLASEKFK